MANVTYKLVADSFALIQPDYQGLQRFSNAAEEIKYMVDALRMSGYTLSVLIESGPYAKQYAKNALISRVLYDNIKVNAGSFTFVLRYEELTSGIAKGSGKYSFEVKHEAVFTRTFDGKLARNIISVLLKYFVSRSALTVIEPGKPEYWEQGNMIMVTSATCRVPKGKFLTPFNIATLSSEVTGDISVEEIEKEDQFISILNKVIGKR